MPGAAARILRASVSDPGQTLVQVVASTLREAFPSLAISNADARRVVMAGAVRLNARSVTRPGARVEPGDRVTVAADPDRLARTRRAVAQAVRMLYADEHVLAVDKPADVPTHATADPRRPHLVGLVARALGVDESGLGVHQRLDAGTSGVVVFGRTAAANRGLSRAFAGREVGKLYLAVVDARRRPDLVAGQQWVSHDPLAPAGRGRRGRQVAAAVEGQSAETAFEVRARRGDRALVEARPKTGRQHQVRAHLAAARAPIVGDPRYGGPPAARLHLHAWQLRLPHPVTGARLVIEAPPPEGWLSLHG